MTPCMNCCRQKREIIKKRWGEWKSKMTRKSRQRGSSPRLSSIWIFLLQKCSLTIKLIKCRPLTANIFVTGPACLSRLGAILEKPGGTLCLVICSTGGWHYLRPARAFHASRWQTTRPSILPTPTSLPLHLREARSRIHGTRVSCCPGKEQELKPWRSVQTDVGGCCLTPGTVEAVAKIQETNIKSRWLRKQ